ncbi:MAG: DHA2 family efflux MFS transporter permease subunit [Chloroflexi bacterium]|nr:MAG: DHA2 family efflux MFS transporter permease subunit [Chloroflexota bacterium]TME45766.1 MAG: DHA2 family efflux MFS transporter permease subunit [Chloroflexota bacterium]
MANQLQATTRAQSIWTLALTGIAFFMVALDSLVVVTALPAIQRELHASLATLEWTVNAFTLAYAAGITTAAALGDRFGRRRLFLMGLVLFSVASAACAVAPSATLLIAARAIQGLGAAVIMPLSLTILVSAFGPKRRAAIVGIWGGIGGLAIASGPLVGGAVTQGLDWHWIFWVNVPIGLIATLFSRVQLAESHGPATRLDLPAATLASAGAIAIVWSLMRSGELGWGNAQVLASLTGGVVLIGGFLLWERGAIDPMLPLRLFASRAFAAANLTAFLMAGSIFAAAFLIAQYFQFGLGYSPLDAGLRLLPWTATPFVVSPIAGLLSERIGRRPLMMAGLVVQAIGLTWIAQLASTGAAYGPFVLPLLIAGIGISMALPIAPAAVMSAVAPHDMGKASGVNSTLQRFGSAFAIAIAAAVFAANGHIGSPASFTTGFRPALMVVAALSILGAISALAIGERRPAVAAARVAA